VHGVALEPFKVQGVSKQACSGDKRTLREEAFIGEKKGEK
jgi:hypothetical protein